jgi:hypothetical protein
VSRRISSNAETTVATQQQQQTNGNNATAGGQQSSTGKYQRVQSNKAIRKIRRYTSNNKFSIFGNNSRKPEGQQRQPKPQQIRTKCLRG